MKITKGNQGLSARKAVQSVLIQLQVSSLRSKIAGGIRLIRKPAVARADGMLYGFGHLNFFSVWGGKNRFFCFFLWFCGLSPAISQHCSIILGEYFRPETLKPLHVGPNFPLLRPKFPSFSSHVKICQ